MYSRQPPPGFGKPQAAAAPAKATAKPLKRPTQARAVFTVQAIYDAFVRIWRRDGWAGVSTRAVALETGISVGTLYDYFPNKAALLSGYVRHCMEQLLQAIEQQAVAPTGLGAEHRLRTLIRLACGVDTPELPWFDAGMLALESDIAEGKHHRRVHEELLAAWTRVLDACTDLPRRPCPEAIQAMHLAVWGGRRYGLLIGLNEAESAGWARQTERMCLALLKTE
ncbi:MULTISPECIES: TetR/AcrR family transcriptional regulator [unclassified Polaromonas]|uniref:TetR/AcrR family transcriptional regulator n=1 Tax=unclassified Polaromonas TaxID=2638319 RepID=UPI000F08633B|nr:MULTISPECIES: TetR/AcrR family transcriptional regulator [unclassified Polaromonas]AYQ28855.1 TetR/AcrR family transcriptional regulator [Polaromonas sp. SP1]QGJ20029.1 TetR family transcriptional regulator [Polaromonas sp. Pch-P]